jgi:hypothetical protein
MIDLGWSDFFVCGQFQISPRAAHITKFMTYLRTNFFDHSRPISSFSVLILNRILVYAMFFKLKKGPRDAKISWKAVLCDIWPIFQMKLRLQKLIFS